MVRATYISDVSAWASEFTFSVPVSVRFSETDMYGHLNNTVAFAYFEYARIEFLKHVGLMNDWLNSEGNTIPVVADLQCDYLQQVFFDEVLTIHVKVATIGNSSIDIHYMVKNAKKETVITGRGSLVQISRATGKGVCWTDEEKLLFAN